MIGNENENFRRLIFAAYRGKRPLLVHVAKRDVSW